MKSKHKKSIRIHENVKAPYNYDCDLSTGKSFYPKEFTSGPQCSTKVMGLIVVPVLGI